MKKLGKIKLNQLSKVEMKKKEMNMVKGGVDCWCSCTCDCTNNCACLYAGEQCSTGDSYYGGSSTNDNSNANMNNQGDSLSLQKGNNLVS